MSKLSCNKCGCEDFSKLIPNADYYIKTKQYYCTNCFIFCKCCNEFLSIDNFAKDIRSSNGVRSVCKKCTQIKNKECKLKAKTDLEYQLKLSIKSTIRIENKALKENGFRLCSGCHKPFHKFDLIKGRKCKECSNENLH